MDVNGNGAAIDVEQLIGLMNGSVKPDTLCSKTKFVTNIAAMNTRMFIQMCILSGCDYLDGITKGVGLVTAQKLVLQHAAVDHDLRIAAIVDELQGEGKGGGKQIRGGYVDAFKKAEMVFYHQRVYDMKAERVVELTPLKYGGAPCRPMSTAERREGGDMAAAAGTVPAMFARTAANPSKGGYPLGGLLQTSKKQRIDESTKASTGGVAKEVEEGPDKQKTLTSMWGEKGKG
jgi:hypothetical protein